MQKTLRSGVALLFAAALAAAPAKQQDEDNYVRATERTVVTVQASAEPVETREQARERTAGGKLRRASATLSSGAVRAGGWLLNVNDDIPSARERKAAAAARQQ